jgi:hypothetical protein
VTKPDGKPMKGANVALSEVRTADSPIRSAADQNLSDVNGHFCIRFVEPGRYLFTVEDTDFDHNLRYMSFYPGVASRSQASMLNIEAGNGCRM